MTIVEMNLTPEAQTPAPAPSAPPKKPSMLELFSEALTGMVERRVDARVNEVLANVATAKLMDSKLEERITEIVQFRISEHVQDEPHHDIDEAVREAVGEIDLDDAVEHAFKHSVNWEDYVDERVRDQVEELVPSDDEIHDKVREVLNDVTFTVSVD